MPAALAALLAAAALAGGPRDARPPPRAAPALVDVAARIPDAIVDLRYATADNLAGAPLYPAGARCLLRADVAARLAGAAARLRARGLRLVLWDCYRPLAAQRALWARVPRPGLVADPRTGSNHNRAAAVDASVAGPAGEPVPVPTGFDAFGPAAHARASAGVAPAARRNRDALRAAMEAEGFRPIRQEWWHFDAPEARGAPILDVALAPFDSGARRAPTLRADGKP